MGCPSTLHFARLSLLGYLGMHRFYEGKIWTGILWLCTGGLFGVGIIVDAILIVLKPEHY